MFSNDLASSNFDILVKVHIHLDFGSGRQIWPSGEECFAPHNGSLLERPMPGIKPGNGVVRSILPDVENVRLTC
tara:strand:- start:199 stop:420 length:222 start_codon:yes stop_codon:yes gene_type:complete